MTAAVRFSRRVDQDAVSPIGLLMQVALSKPQTISLAAGFIDPETLPADAVRTAVNAILSDPARARAALQYGSTPGDPDLRQRLADHLADMERSSGVADYPPEDADNVLVGTGSQQLLYLAGEVLLDPGDVVLAGVPTYFVFTGAAENMGAEIVPVATDEDGLIPDALRGTLQGLKDDGRLERVKFLYEVDYFNNPSGRSLAADRRAEIVAIVREFSTDHRILILEDAAYREMRFAGDDVRSLRSHDRERDTVLYAATFSKPFSAGLKCGWMVVPESLREAVARQKTYHDFGSANFVQQIVLHAMVTGAYDEQVLRLREGYRVKAEAMVETLEDQLADLKPHVHWTVPTGGLYVWVTLPEDVSTAMDSPFFRDLLAAEVLVVPGRFSYAGADAADHHVRLTYGYPPIEQVREGTRRFARVVRQHLEARVPAAV